MENQPKYLIEFKQDEKNVCLAENIPALENAVQLALELHRVANTSHIIHVIHDDIIDVTFVRYAK